MFTRSAPPASTSARARARTHRPSRARASSSSSPFERSSPGVVAAEMTACYALIERLGRGAVYLGSSRTQENSMHFVRARELARDIARLLNCTTWSGVGPGIMDAVTRGALDAGKPVGGFMILLEAGQGKLQQSRVHPYLPRDVYLTSSFFSARKHGLVDAGVRVNASDKTCFVAFPGGVGTLDEIFEILALFQLNRIGTAHDVPFIFMNYDGHYDGLLSFLLRDMVASGVLREGELASRFVSCADNASALAHLRAFYAL